MKGWKKERIIRVLLNRIDDNLTKYRISKESECSFAWADEFLKQLEKKQLVKGTKVINAKALFDYWLSIHIRPKYRQYNIGNPMDFLYKVQEENKLEFALTTYAAENTVQRYLFLSRYDIYVKDVDKWDKLVMKSGVRGGGNMKVFYDADPHTFYNSSKRDLPVGSFDKGEIHGAGWDFPVVSLPQLILDLLIEAGPSVEAAQMLINKHFGSNKDVRKV